VIKVSIVNYYNTLPFRWSIRNNPLLKEIDLQEDIPSICAQKLKFGQVDLALVPVAVLPELTHYKVVTDYCIGAVGKVDSVKLYSQVDLTEISRITLDYQSKSSITLTKVLAKEFWKINPEYKPAMPGFESEVKGTEAAVIIGDRAFEWNGRYNFEWDLSEQWQLYTKLPFVFAAWVTTNQQLSPDFLERFNTVLKHGIENIDLAIAEMPTKLIPGLNASLYLKHRISYLLDSDKRNALDLFLTKL
jgi:chorismate dehydratase